MDGAGWLEVELDGVTIIDPEKTEKLEEYVTILYETRKNKGMTPAHLLKLPSIHEGTSILLQPS